jgi:hypothetical protein
MTPGSTPRIARAVQPLDWTQLAKRITLVGDRILQTGKEGGMALVTSSKLEQLAQFVAGYLRGNRVVHEAWVGRNEESFTVLIIVDTENPELEQEVRGLHLPLLDEFPGLPIDLYVTNIQRISDVGRRELVRAAGHRIEI